MSRKPCVFYVLKFFTQNFDNIEKWQLREKNIKVGEKNMKEINAISHSFFFLQ